MHCLNVQLKCDYVNVDPLPVRGWVWLPELNCFQLKPI